MQGATTVACGRLLGGSDQLPECWSSTWPALSQKGLGVGTGPGGDAGISVRVQQGLHGCGGQPTHPSAQGWCVPSSHPALLSSGLGPHAAAAVLVTLMGVGSDVQESLPWQQLTHSTLRGGAPTTCSWSPCWLMCVARKRWQGWPRSQPQRGTGLLCSESICDSLHLVQL